LKQKSVFKLLSSFTQSEFDCFCLFAASSFHNTRGDISRFVAHISEAFPVLEGENFTDSIIYSKVYGKPEINKHEINKHEINKRDVKKCEVNKQVVKNLLHRTLLLCEKFLIQNALESDRFMQDALLISELQKRKQISKASKLAQISLDYFRQTENYTISFLKKQYDLLELVHHLHDLHEPRYKIQSGSNKLSASIKYFLVSVLRTLNDYEVNSFVEAAGDGDSYINRIKEIIDFPRALDLIKETEPEEYPLIACYYYGLKSKIDDPEGNYREELKRLSFENIEKFRAEDNIEFWQMIFASYIFSKSSKGPVDVKTLHEINKMYINRGVMYRDSNGYAEENSYHNIAMQAIAANDLAWAGLFINTYKEQLNPAVRENTYSFLMGYFNMNKGDYGNVISFLVKIKSPDIPVNLTVRWMLFRTYYELGHYFEAESAIDAFKKFITSSRRITKQSVSSYPILLRFSSQLVKAKISGKELKLEYYLEAKSIPSFIGRRWLLEKMEELVKPSPIS
jgi:hypothetical protein